MRKALSQAMKPSREEDEGGNEALGRRANARDDPYLLESDWISCEDCGKRFPTVQEMRSHAALKHGWRHPARAWAHGTVCQACNKDFSAELAFAFIFSMTRRLVIVLLICICGVLR